MISEDTKRRLLMDSGGICANPDCHTSLYEELRSGRVGTVYELAHVIARSPIGPRGAEAVEQASTDNYDNLVLLCPRCHRLIDKNPDDYPIDVVLEWKGRHRDTVRAALGQVADSRQVLKAMVGSLLRENRAIHRAFGPESIHPEVLQEEAAEMWRNQVLAVILPNNRRVYSTLIANEHLLTEEERAIVEQFFAHMIGLEFNHLSGDKNPVAPRFPEGMNALLGGL